jgi:hypothetical protein
VRTRCQFSVLTQLWLLGVNRLSPSFKASKAGGKVFALPRGIQFGGRADRVQKHRFRGSMALLAVWGSVCTADQAVCIFQSQEARVLIDSKDCAGVAGGKARADRCGRCDANPKNDCRKDCAGAWGGKAKLDVCGVCNGRGRCPPPPPPADCPNQPLCPVVETLGASVDEKHVTYRLWVKLGPT